jgi:hypothetical protein
MYELLILKHCGKKYKKENGSIITMRKRFRNIQVPFIFLPILLLIFSFFSYGFWQEIRNLLDDWAYVWTRLELGYEGLLRHFSFSRPVAGQFIIWQF